MLAEEIIQRIKIKKELSEIDDSLIRERLNDYLAKKRILLSNLSPRQSQIVIKDVRAELRKNIGMFRTSIKDRYKFLEKSDIPSLLKTHSSTKERFDFYPQLKKIIKNLGINSILDLGCGINPLALATAKTKYYAVDINLGDLEIVKAFFQKNSIPGEVIVCDLNKIDKCSLPEVDLVLILKLFDILNRNPYKSAKEILEKVKAKHIIISFPKITLSGKLMNRPRRMWFEKILNSLFYKFDIIESNNEIFYVI